MSRRVDPFAIDLAAFTAEVPARPPAAAIRSVSEAAAFPSRSAVPEPRRGRRTGRNVQLIPNSKITDA